ncbi:MAG: thiamine phosphate synthase [Thermodesulfobacteriota bacterium]
MTDAPGRPRARPPGAVVAAPFYPILDAARALTDRRPLRVLAEKLARAGVPWLQLRCKGMPASSFLDLARELVADAAAHGARLIVNDRLDVALASGAAGVHLGQEDLSLAHARRIAGERLVIGVSTHDVAEARAAADGGADYVGFGPMFATGSKPDALSRPRTLAELRAVRAAVRIPIVAIGGITEATASDVLAAGADAVAMIGALAAAPDPAGLAARLLALAPRRR